MSDNTVQGTNVGFTSMLTLLFVGLKLGGVIEWSWWWVLSPVWITAGLAAVVGVIILFLSR